MSDAPAAGGSDGAAGASAGARLRAARQAQGLHIAALAASMKVSQAKLEALEGDRLGELPDVTFARALAKTVCRTLKIDPAPVLALMPDVGDRGLEKVDRGLNTTFRDHPGRALPTDLGILRRPAVWLPLLIVVAAGFVYLMPQEWIARMRPAPVAASAPTAAAQVVAVSASDPADAASAPAAPAPAPPPAADVGAAVAAAPASAPDGAAEPAAAASLIEFRVSGESWIGVLDASGATLLQRKLEPGEFVGLDGTPPFRLTIGNAAVTQLNYRGRAVDLKASTRDNVARLVLE